MHRRHTIACLKCAEYRLLALLEEEEQSGRRIHTPKQIYNPEAQRWQYHWHFRGHTRQIQEAHVPVIMEFINSPSAKRLSAATR